jgi:hypothetical protein
MGGESPNVIMFDGYGEIMSVQNGTATPTNTSALLVAGTDGTFTRFHNLTLPNTSPVAATSSLVVAQSPNLPKTVTLSSVNVNASANGNNTLIAGVASQTVRVFKVALVFSVGGTAIFQDGASTQITGPLVMYAGGTIVLDMDITNPWFLTSAGNGFVVNLANGAVVGGVIYYTQS